MKANGFINYVRLGVLSTLLLVSPNLLCQGTCMYLDGIEGIGGEQEACDPPYFPITSVSFSLVRDINSPTGSSQERNASAPKFSGVVVTRVSDVNTPLLFESAAVGKGVIAEINYFGHPCNPTYPYQRISLDNALVSEFNSTSEEGGRPHEQISLNFTLICLFATEFNDRCETGPEIGACYDISLGKRK